MITIDTATATEPRIDRKAVAHMLRGGWCWLALILAVGYVVVTASSPSTRVYAWCYGPAYVLAVLTAFAGRYQKSRQATTGRWHVAYQAPALLTGLTVAAAVLGLIAAAAYTGSRANAAASFAKAVGHAPGYSWDAAAAGYWACGELARGTDPEALVARMITKGDAQGNLYTTMQASRIVEQAPKTLCTNVR